VITSSTTDRRSGASATDATSHCRRGARPDPPVPGTGVVVGLVLDILRSLGAELDRQVDEDDPIDADPQEVIAR
jgi:hypothetical protein